MVIVERERRKKWWNWQKGEGEKCQLQGVECNTQLSMAMVVPLITSPLLSLPFEFALLLIPTPAVALALCRLHGTIRCPFLNIISSKKKHEPVISRDSIFLFISLCLFSAFSRQANRACSVLLTVELFLCGVFSCGPCGFEFVS